MNADPTQAELDADLEQRIEQARIAMMEAPNAKAQRAHFDAMRGLIARRSASRVTEMESRLPGPWRS